MAALGEWKDDEVVDPVVHLFHPCGLPGVVVVVAAKRRLRWDRRRACWDTDRGHWNSPSDSLPLAWDTDTGRAAAADNRHRGSN